MTPGGDGHLLGVAGQIEAGDGWQCGRWRSLRLCMTLQAAFATWMPGVGIHIELLVAERIEGDLVAAHGDQEIVIIHCMNGGDWTRIRRQRSYQFSGVHIIDQRSCIITAHHTTLAVLANGNASDLPILN